MTFPGLEEQGGGWEKLLATVLGGLSNVSDPNAEADPNATPAATAPVESDSPWSEAIPTGGTSAAPSLMPSILNQPFVPPKRKPIDYLLMAASPAVSGLVQSLLARRHRGRAFAAGLLGGGFNTALQEAERPELIKQMQRKRDIENILLQQKVRGTPVGGQNTQTGQPEYRYPGTNENATPGFGPLPRVPRVPKIINVRDAQGNEVPYDVNDKNQGVPITTDQGGVQVPLVSRPKPEKPLRELRRGNTIKGQKKSDEQYYWVEQGKEPVATGLMVGESDKPERESDIKRQERQDVNQSAVKFLQDARGRLGPGKKPEEYANAALDRFQEAAKTNPTFGKYAEEVTSTIRNVGKRVRGEDELATLISAMLAGTSTGTQPSK